MAAEEGNNIVISDLLCYLQCKIDSVPKESLVHVITNFYKQESITSAREILYKDLPDTFPRIVRHVNKRDNVSAMYDVLQALLAEKAIVFVCRDLNNIPPLSLKNVDPVMLLKQTSGIQDEMSELAENHKAVKNQLTVMSETLDQIRDSICSTDNRTSAVTYSSATKQNLPLRKIQSAPTSRACAELPLGEVVQGESAGMASPSCHDENYPDVTPSVGALGGSQEERAPRGSSAKVGGRYVVDSDGFMHRKPRQRKPPIIGKGKQSKLRAAVMVRKREVFVTRLHEETTCGDIKDFVISITGSSTTEVEKLNNKHPGYASFRVACDEQYLKTLLCEDTWDDGILVRPFFHAKKQRNPIVSQQVHSSD